QEELEDVMFASFIERRASGDVNPKVKILESVKEQLKNREDDLNKLRLVAPQAGTVLPPPLLERQGDESVHLPTWSGSPLDPENIGAQLKTGTKFCQIGDPRSMEARLVIDQRDVELLESKLRENK